MVVWDRLTARVCVYSWSLLMRSGFKLLLDIFLGSLKSRCLINQSSSVKELQDASFTQVKIHQTSEISRWRLRTNLLKRQASLVRKKLKCVRFEERCFKLKLFMFMSSAEWADHRLRLPETSEAHPSTSRRPWQTGKGEYTSLYIHRSHVHTNTRHYVTLISVL